MPVMFDVQRSRAGNRQGTRRELLAAGAIPAAAAVAACTRTGGQPASQAPPGATFSRNVTISYMTNSDPQQLALTQETATRDFAAVQPLIKVDLIPTPFGEILTKLQATVAAGTPPDVSELSYPWMINLASKRALLSLEPYTRQDRVFDFADFFPPYVDAGKYKGTLYGIAGAGGPFVTYYNHNRFESAGVRPPAATADPNVIWDWNAFLDTTKRLTRPDTGDGGQYGSLSGDYWNWVYSAGGEIVNRTLDKCMLDRPEAIEGIQLWADLANVHQVAPTPQALQGQNTADWFRSGRLASLPSGRFFAFQQLANAPGLRWHVTPLPKKRTAIVHFNANMTGILQATKEPDAAWAFVSYIEGKEKKLKTVRTGSSVPGRRSVAESTEYLDSPALPREANKLFTDLMGRGLGRTLPGTPAWPDINTLINEHIGTVRRGERAAADFAREITPRIDQLLKEAG